MSYPSYYVLRKIKSMYSDDSSQENHIEQENDVSCQCPVCDVQISLEEYPPIYVKARQGWFRQYWVAVVECWHCKYHFQKKVSSDFALKFGSER